MCLLELFWEHRFLLQRNVLGFRGNPESPENRIFTDSFYYWNSEPCLVPPSHPHSHSTCLSKVLGFQLWGSLTEVIACGGSMDAWLSSVYGLRQDLSWKRFTTSIFWKQSTKRLKVTLQSDTWKSSPKDLPELHSTTGFLSESHSQGLSLFWLL